MTPNRSDRPRTVAHGRRPRLVDHNCPFCWGNEHATAEEITRVGPGGPAEPGWRVRVVKNRYPVVGGAGAATGECEVVVFRAHERRLEDLEVDEVAEILAVIRDRVAAQSVARTSVQVFVNAEAEAGASIAHPHAQLIALDFVPPALALEFAMISSLGADPLLRDLELAEELDLVVVEGAVAAWCPWAMPLPYGVRIAARTPGPPFTELGAADIAAVAQTLRDVVRAMNDVLDHPAYNVVVFSDQARAAGAELVRRWRIEVIPRITVGGGFEIGTAVTTHATEPAVAAATLRAQVERNATPASGQSMPRRAHS
ncbi:MAG TPA: hypothetical protein VGP92_08225 [Acidimicrobiia bacterium]|nr:hypothetical protein [Acidimicrobiia bacterium]